MGIVTFSIPDNIKEAFEQTFDGREQSEIVAKLLQDAVDARRRQADQISDNERRERFKEACDRMEELRRAGPTFSDEEIAEARREGRP